MMSPVTQAPTYPADLARYVRQMCYPPLGETGQRKLAASTRVAVMTPNDGSDEDDDRGRDRDRDRD